MGSLWSRPIAEILEAVASRRPAPGGGATAALTAAFGVALLSMALKITVKKNGEDAELGRTLGRLTELREQLQAQADEDVQVFDTYVRATRLPDKTKEDRQEHEGALKAAGQAAMEVPLKLARTVVEAMNLTPSLIRKVHSVVVSDVGAGAAILEGALHASLLTVEINLPHVTAEDRVAIQTERDILEAQGKRLVTETLNLTRERLREAHP